jgi:hypothetical protein
MHRTILTKEALEGIAEKKVPLVCYDSEGNRIVIGEATVSADDSGLRVDEVNIQNEDVAERLSDVDGVSLGFIQAKTEDKR